MYLLAPELGPPSVLEHMVELREIPCAKKIDEAVSYVALVFDVAGQVEEVVGV